MTLILYKSLVVKNLKLNNRFRHLYFLNSDKYLDFLPGQHLLVKINEKMFRPYSIASTPQKLPSWEIILDTFPNGQANSFLKKLKAGEFIFTTKAQGNLFLRKKVVQNIITIATGCGIASIKPILENVIFNKQINIYLFWGLRNEKDLFFEEQLKKWEISNSNFKYQITYTKPINSKNIANSGYVQKLVSDRIKLFSEISIPYKKTSFYLCGNSEMIKENIELLRKAGFLENQIYTEKYY